MAENKLYEAAIIDDAVALSQLLEKDPFLLDRVSYTSSNKTPLHVATMKGNFKFVEEILDRNPELAEVLDSQQLSPLHIASAKGYVDIAKILLRAAPDMCLSRDFEGKNPLHIASAKGYVDIAKILSSAAPDLCLSRDFEGKNPLHLAAMKDRVLVLEELVRLCPLAAREKMDGGQTVMHLCVKYDRLECLRILVPILNEEIVNVKDNDGDNIMHMALRDQKIEIIQYLAESGKINMNGKNSKGQTVLDILDEASEEEDTILAIRKILQPALRKSRGIRTRPAKWLTKKRDTILVVAILIATMAFQAGLNPPGGLWQDDLTEDSQGNPVLDPHHAGESVMSYKYPKSYWNFVRFNSLTLFASLCIILLLMGGSLFLDKHYVRILMATMCLTMLSIIATYGIALRVLSPTTYTSVSRTDLASLGLWVGVALCGVTVILLVDNTVRLIAKWLRRRGIVI